jgi:hypothetical protein
MFALESSGLHTQIVDDVLRPCHMRTGPLFLARDDDCTDELDEIVDASESV